MYNLRGLWFVGWVFEPPSGSFCRLHAEALGLACIRIGRTYIGGWNCQGVTEELVACWEVLAGYFKL